jgi:hypothetical protein
VRQEQRAIGPAFCLWTERRSQQTWTSGLQSIASFPQFAYQPASRTWAFYETWRPTTISRPTLLALDGSDLASSAVASRPICQAEAGDDGNRGEESRRHLIRRRGMSLATGKEAALRLTVAVDPISPVLSGAWLAASNATSGSRNPGARLDDTQLRGTTRSARSYSTSYLAAAVPVLGLGFQPLFACSLTDPTSGCPCAYQKAHS